MLYTRNHENSCFARGLGFLKTTINVPLTAEDQCGVKYNPATETYYILLEVRQHQMIILQDDRTFNITCPKTNQSGIQPDLLRPVDLGVYERGNSKTHDVVFGRNYSIQIQSFEDRDFLVTSCMAFAGMNYSVELSDYHGCARDLELMSNFRYGLEQKLQPQLRTATAELHHMFKFPEQNAVHFQCALIYCSPYCRRVDCDRRRDEPLANLVDEQFASTTVRVAEVGSAGALQIQQTHCDTYYDLLVVLCILFAALFVFCFLLNICFCIWSGKCRSKDSKNASKRDEDEIYVVEGAPMRRSPLGPMVAYPMYRPPQPALWYPVNSASYYRVNHRQPEQPEMVQHSEGPEQQQQQASPESMAGSQASKNLLITKIN